MTITLTNYNEYRAYFEAIASAHTLIQGFVFGDDEVFDSLLKKGHDLPVLWLQEYEPARVEDPFADNVMERKLGSLVIYNKPADDTFEARHTATDATEEIVLDIISKLRKDYVEGVVIIPFDNMTYGLAEDFYRGGVRYVGTRLEFEFMDPVDIGYDAARWS